MDTCFTLIMIMSGIIIWFIIDQNMRTEQSTVDYKKELMELRWKLYEHEETIKKCYDKFAEKE